MRPAHPEPTAWLRIPSLRRKVYQSRPTSEADQWSAKILNVSPTGIGLLMPRTFQPGEVLSVELPGDTGYGSQTLLAYVIHAKPQPGGECALGCHFALELGDQELEVLGARKVRPPTPDGRSWVRFPCEITTSSYAVPGGGPEQWPARIVNLSDTGVILATPRPFEAGALLHLDLPVSARPARRSRLVCVVYLTAEEPGEWIVGCNFAGELDEDELEAFQ